MAAQVEQAGADFVTVLSSEAGLCSPLLRGLVIKASAMAVLPTIVGMTR